MFTFSSSNQKVRKAIDSVHVRLLHCHYQGRHATLLPHYTTSPPQCCVMTLIMAAKETMFVSVWIRFTYLCLQQGYGVFSLIYSRHLTILWSCYCKKFTAHLCPQWFRSHFDNNYDDAIYHQQEGRFIKKTGINLLNYQQSFPKLLL